MPKTPESKQEMIDKCREYYRGNEKRLENVNTFDLTYKSNDAIKWYTEDTFVYQIVNKALRTEDIDELFIFRFFIIDLSLNLARKYKELKKIEPQPIIDLYRGVNLSSDELDTLKKNVGNLISTNDFLSTSRSRKAVYRFARNAI
ncbi:unnamed protein product [Didymodactylos carnosus]|nr:unnamed protein product [Didymodactylos carnosus]